MDFLLKKLISAFLLPVPFSVFFILIGFLFLLANRARKTQVTCIFLGLLCLSLFSMGSVSYKLINKLQSEYKPLVKAPGNVTKIVVLGGGVSGGKNYPPNITLRSSSLSRLIEGIRLFHQIKKSGENPELILSGGRVFQSQAESGVMRNTAVMLDIDPKNIVVEDGSRDTNEEAMFLKKQLGKDKFILVTSGFHMPRSMMIFKAQGMNPIAAPTQLFGPTNLKIKSYIPSSLSLAISDIAIHEYLGILWAKISNHL